VKNGSVRFGYVHFAFLGDESVWAAEASECADEQGKFWEYHDLLFNNQHGENGGAFSKDNLKKFAATLGLDTTQFNACVDSGKYMDVVKKEVAFGQQLGVQSTPTFVLNGQPIVGGQPFETFQKMIDAALGR
jgi:protein-disulfide isomerase